ncbi:MAG: alpha/beta hydrolase [Bacteroidales bacterium]|nr:alpha/beta hydrolase [Bacteroidales bacterium]
MINIKSNIDHKELKLNGYSIHYFCSGDSTKELLIFLHPAFADHKCFDKQIDYFAKDYRVITIDMLGHGLSKADKAKDKIDMTVSHIDTILRLEGYYKAHLVGVSIGSLIAQYYGLKNPEKVISMTILGGYDINADNTEISKAQRSEQIKWIFKALFSMNSFRRYVASVSVSDTGEQVRFYEMSKMFTRKSFMIMSGLSNVLQKRDSVKLSFPLLIMSGENDIELAKKSSKKWQDSQSNSKYYLIENAGHCANMDNSDRFNEILMDFIKQRK